MLKKESFHPGKCTMTLLGTACWSFQIQFGDGLDEDDVVAVYPQEGFLPAEIWHSLVCQVMP
jgi:hypothetical protein